MPSQEPPTDQQSQEADPAPDDSDDNKGEGMVKSVFENNTDVYVSAKYEWCQYSSVWFGLVWCGLVYFSFVWFGLICV